MTRGVERRTIYLDAYDRRRFLTLLEQTVTRHAWRLHAYVLMSNHYHLFFETTKPNLAEGMHELNGQYAAYFNTRHARVGHLFGGRYKSYLVDREGYYVEVARYIVLNPVRSQFVEHPRAWRWSSYRATAGLEPIPRWLDVGPLLNCFHRADRQLQRDGYCRFVAAGLKGTPRPWPDAAMQIMTRLRAALPNIDVSSAARAAFVLTARRHLKASVAGLARYLGISRYAAIRLIRSSEERLEHDSSVAALINTTRTLWGQAPF